MAHHHHHPSSPYTAGAFAAALSASLAANNDNNNNNHTSPRPSLTAASPRTLPTDVLQWILDVTGRLPLAIARRSTHAQAAAKTIQAMQLRGLEYLKVTEMKTLWGRLQTFAPVVAKQPSLGNPIAGRKAVQAAALMRYFFADDACIILDSTVIQAVRQDLATIKSSASSATQQRQRSHQSTTPTTPMFAAAPASQDLGDSQSLFRTLMEQGRHRESLSASSSPPDDSLRMLQRHQRQQPQSTPHFASTAASSQRGGPGGLASRQAAAAVPGLAAALAAGAPNTAAGGSLPNPTFPYYGSSPPPPPSLGPAASSYASPAYSSQQPSAAAASALQSATAKRKSMEEAYAAAMSAYRTNRRKTNTYTDNPGQPPQHSSDQSHGHYPGPPPPLQEPADPGVTPAPGTIEGGLARALQAIGFTDMREILTAIRACIARDGAQATTADTCMLECVKRREDMDEARQMDEARLESERSRKAEAAAIRASVEADVLDDMMRSSLDRLRAKHFADSWLLQDAAVRQALGLALKQSTAHESKKNGNAAGSASNGSDDEDDDGDDGDSITRNSNNNPVMTALIQLLKLEQKARKWYKAALPSAWFVRVCARRLAPTPKNESDGGESSSSNDENSLGSDNNVNDRGGISKSMVSILQGECARLQKGMFELAEQTRGGVPKMFLTAFDEHGDCNAKRTEDDDDDDDKSGAVGAFRPASKSGTSANDAICID